MAFFSPTRMAAVMVKEFRQMRRDRVTFAIMIGIPIMQLIIFGYAINFDPKGLPTAITYAETSDHTRELMAALRNSGYFEIIAPKVTEAEAARMLDRGEVQFVFSFPSDFERALFRGESPSILLQVDATDPVAAGSALGAVTTIVPTLFGGASSPRATLTVHRLYNPESVTRYNIVPGLLGVVLTMTMVLVTGVAMTRERERGTMENLLSTPVRPLEVMIGKIIPYIIVGYIQAGLILFLAWLIFNVPMMGSIALLLTVSFIFIAANLSVGITFSTVARNQLQAVQMAFFFFLPSLLLSGFMFPFRGCPNGRSGSARFCR